jgi:Tfp pilus assembly protein PilF
MTIPRLDLRINPPGLVRSASLILLISLFLASCNGRSGLPQPGSNEYRELVTAFYVGLAGLQTGEDVRAKEKLTRATVIAPGEPASWANLGLLSVRQQEFDAAYERTEKARSLAPDNSRIEALLGLIESRRGKLPEAIAHLEKAVSLDSKNVKAIYAIAQEIERQGAENSDAEAARRLEQIVSIDPNNLAVLVDLARLSAKRGDGEALKRAVNKLVENSSLWPAEAKAQMATLQEAANGANPRAASTQIAYLRNTLVRVPVYRQNLNAVKTPAEFISEPFLKFIKLPSPSSAPAPADMAMTFTSEPLPGAEVNKLHSYRTISFDSESKPALVSYNKQELKIAQGAKITFGNEATPSGWGVAALDFNYDFKTDLVTVGGKGVHFYRQENLNSFTEVTAATSLPDAILKDEYHYFVWTFDFDLDGDLDLLTISDRNGRPVVLRNNGDGTFKDLFPFNDLTDVYHLATADIDGDGDPDLGIVNSDNFKFKILINERLGQYRELAIPANIDGVIAVAVADIDSNGIVDFVVLNREGQILRISDKGAGNDLEVAELTRVVLERPPFSSGPIEEQLKIADLDNNGSLDIIAGPNQVLLSDTNGKFNNLNFPSDLRVQTIADVNGDGRLDLIGLQLVGTEYRPVQIINRGTKNYQYQTIRTRSAKSSGDQRINSFGIGGEIEIRSGLLTQKQVITSPFLHFGLGDNRQVDVARIVWPNGSVQAEFELKAGQSVLAEQRLKGSCPMLFAWDGKQISYVKDTAPWSPALGLHINAQIVAGIYQTEEWFRIRGDQLAPRDGFYDLRVTAELWEVYYIDHYSLMTVDHPADTEVFADERFAVPPPPLKLFATSKTQPFARAVDDRGTDVSTVVRDLDEKYLDTFGKGHYQGVTRDHWVELELPNREGPQPAQTYLIGHGFLHPTDGSVNIAYGQSSYPPPQGLSIETPDAQGNWSTAKTGLGFPAGKRKTIVLDLNGIFRPGAPHKLRLRTNMEIYWDQLEWADGLPEATYQTQRIALSAAELQYRGFSRFTQADDSSPELPDYNMVGATSPKWRDLIGYYTRYGDVRELLEKIDDRMTIINAGDELRLKFPAPPPPPAGWVRDYVMVGDGWIKDGDLNSTFSKTVLPLPYHGMKDYTIPPRRLEDDPAYQRHPEDWQKFHTRYVTPERFLKALRANNQGEE